jgi:hypothetical protein
MNPMATLTAMQIAETDGDWDTLADRSRDLIRWVDNGGCLPSVLTPAIARAHALSMLRTAKCYIDHSAR